MTDKHPLPMDRPTIALSDWPTLIDRAVDDVSRIVRSEAHTIVISSGALCMLCALVFLLHQWFPWWQAFGITGAAALLVGVVSNVVISEASEESPSK
jgi:hypothetical protein